jgi:hypothetical protein
MHVGVALLAAKTQDVDAFGGNPQRKCSADGTDQGLHGEVVVEWEVLNDAFSVFDRCDEDIAALDVRVGQERNVVLVSVDNELPAR